MSRLRLVLVASLLAPSVGCESFREWVGKNPRPNANAGAVPKVTADQLVGYLNAHADRLQTLSYGSVTVSAREGLLEYNLSGHLSAAQPRNFRMVVSRGGLVDAKVDLGSNEQQFWAYLAVPTVEPLYVFAAHSDFEGGRARLPGNMPFEPDWVLQALGMKKFTPDQAYEVRPDEKARTYTLSWPGRTPNNVEVRKEVVFAADDADAARNQPQVRRHLVRDMKGKVIASAEVKSAHTLAAGGTDPVTRRPYVVQYPTEIELKSDEQKFKMVMRLDAAKVNQQLSQQDVRRLFDLPNIAGRQPIDLAHARFDSPK